MSKQKSEDQYENADLDLAQLIVKGSTFNSLLISNLCWRSSSVEHKIRAIKICSILQYKDSSHTKLPVQQTKWT
jgi:hypothetical protein